MSSSFTGPRSLFEMASSVAVKNIKSIKAIGFMPYESVRHVLAKVDSAVQLRQIELNSPQIQGETGELWLKLIENDFPMEFKTKAYKPKTEDKWYKVWEKYKRDHDRSLQESEEQLRSALVGLRQDKEKKLSKIVDGHLLPSRKKRPTGPKDTTTSQLSFGGGSRTKTLTGAGVMRKARREAKEVRNIQGSLSRSVTAPLRLLEKQHLKAPPAAMLREQRIAAQPDYFTPELQQHELELERQRSVAMAEHAQRAAYITDSEDSDCDEQHGTHQPPKPVAPPSSRGEVFIRAPAPVRTTARSGKSMFQRKFGGSGKKAVAPISKQSAAAKQGKADSSPSAKKRTSSQAELDEPPAKRETLKKPVSRPMGSPEAGSSSGFSSPNESAPKMVVIRKKKPVNIFMKRPVKR